MLPIVSIADDAGVGEITGERVGAFWAEDLDLTKKLGPIKTGIASWYGGRFHGRKTASGERYNKYAMTCASKTLPLGTRLEVTNLNNGRKAIVRVNDRGPYIRGRILDLSYGVAKKLGFSRSGTTKISYRIIDIQS